ncbi:phage tail protein [Cupriavidus sp. UGS-1]|uniref:phage tail protein n=1 Tax=Cupriavidus sp. UGS-1 TaxID=2899826 RepID=UPI001E34B3D0|nr:phage tail protein [Cupriavidus sp. UGS-1]MCD9124031.1 phage tail protein [Cupriavidus sp. UGS-1]
MKKPDSLRAALTAAAPSLKNDPDKLLVFADEGSVIAVPGASLSFEYRYTLHAILLDFAGDADVIFAAIVEWVWMNQRELIANRDRHKDGITFDVDLLGNATCDLSIKLKLTERVIARRDDAGQLGAEAKPEPTPSEWEKTGLAG